MTGRVSIWWARIWNVPSQSPWVVACLFWPCNQDLGLLLLQGTFFVLLGKKGFWDRDLGPGQRAYLGHFHLPRSYGWLGLFQITAQVLIKQWHHTCPWTPFSLLLPLPLSLRAAGPYARVPGTTWNVHNLTRPFTFAERDSIRSQHRGHVAMALRVATIPVPT